MIYSRVVFPRHKSRMWKQARLQKKAYVSIRRHASVRIRQDTSAYEAGEAAQKHTSAYVSILRQQTSAYVRITYEAGEPAADASLSVPI